MCGSECMPVMCPRIPRSRTDSSLRIHPQALTLKNKHFQPIFLLCLFISLSAQSPYLNYLSMHAVYISAKYKFHLQTYMMPLLSSTIYYSYGHWWFLVQLFTNYMCLCTLPARLLYNLSESVPAAHWVHGTQSSVAIVCAHFQAWWLIKGRQKELSIGETNCEREVRARKFFLINIHYGGV